MNVIENQQLWFDAVLSYRTRVEKASLVMLIKHVRDNIETLGLEVTDNVVLSVDEEISEENKTILGVEVIVPIDRPFSSNIHYVFKPYFKLENAVVLKYSGKASELPQAGRELCEYAVNKHFSVLTNVYYYIKQLSGDDVVANAYVGVNGNRL